MCREIDGLHSQLPSNNPISLVKPLALIGSTRAR